MTGPQIYDNLSINVDSDALQSASNQLIGSGQGNDGVGMLGHIADNVLAIEQIMHDLKLGWAGNTADEANAFFAKWNATMISVFGTNKIKDSGSMNRVAMALQGAALNYSHATDGITAIFQSMANGLAPSTPTTSSIQDIPPPTTWTTEWWQGAVSELW